MSIGASVRRMFGRHEPRISELWRAGFVNLDELYGRVRQWVPVPRSILEIGCGEGAGTERLSKLYPDADILAIDIAPNLGRLYGGGTNRVRFRQVTTSDLVAESDRFDLIVMCDVLHHIPPEQRRGVLDAARSLLTSDGHFVCKEWARAATPIHWIAYAADRWLTGDRVQFMSRSEAEVLILNRQTPLTVRDRATIKPWRNNFLLLLQPAS